MTVRLTRTTFVASGTQHVALSSLLSITADGNNPTYLIVNGLDRNEYTAAGTGQTGTLTGNGATDTFSSVSGDTRSTGIVFTWDAANDTYENATYGNLLNLTFNTSAGVDELADLSFFGTNSLPYATAYAASNYGMLATPSQFTSYGTATFATEPGYSGTPGQATPNRSARPP